MNYELFGIKQDSGLKKEKTSAAHLYPNFPQPREKGAHYIREYGFQDR